MSGLMIANRAGFGPRGIEQTCYRVLNDSVVEAGGGRRGDGLKRALQLGDHSTNSIAVVESFRKGM
jgi:hypothetical protein